MRLSVSGTYSSGKTLTVLALSHLTGLPRTVARTMREILPEAVPGKPLAECTWPEFLQLVMRRHVERAVHERLLGDGFVSDGSSLQEWTYGTLRVSEGVNPTATAHLAEGEAVPRTPETDFFEQVMIQYGVAFKQHVARTYDCFVHLRDELPIVADGHRPMNARFRRRCDELLLRTLDELGVPYHVVGGPVEQRLERITELFDLPRLIPTAEAVRRARADYDRQDLRLETERIRPDRPTEKSSYHTRGVR
ncbi:AAA family ATPase [Kitasatospora sp. NPDC052896]|uniref:AAA family ATPase n=1 Tax=Kitasatospora sp. NPDC052896 TaxID=3364061 RepID=UPI0037C8AC99